MTQRNKTTLTLLFEQGDIPTGTNYADLIDSYVNVVETSAQSMAGPLVATEIITPRVSATNANITGITSAATLVVTTNISAVAANITTITGSAATLSGSLSAAGVTVTGDVSAASGTVYASAMRSTNGFIAGVGVVSAAGTAQGTAASLTNVINRGKGVADGVTTGFTPLANRAGLVQYLFNEGVSANLWPPTGGFINGLAVNTPYAIPASAMITIVHLTASAYGVIS